MVVTKKRIFDEPTRVIVTPVQSLNLSLPFVFGASFEEVFTSIYTYGNFDEESTRKWFDPISALSDYLRNIHNIYSDYDYLPVYTDGEIDDEDYYRYISNKFTQHLLNYLPIFTKTLNLINQSVDSSRKLIIDTKRGGNNKDTKTFGNKITGSSDTSSMNEVSPINATLGDIVTPNNKNVAEFGSTTEKTGTDTIDYKIDETVNDIHTETSPAYFNEIMKIYEKYNIYDIIHKCYRKVIHEFNNSL